jgi:hypothetical protein
LLKAVATDNIGNSSVSTITIVVEAAVGISESSALIDTKLIKVYPNPANDLLNIQFSNPGLENAEVAIYNVSGEKVFSHSISGSQATFHIKQLPAGVYVVKITCKDSIQIERFIKK